MVFYVGLTILGYHYEGLRINDFVTLIQNLKAQMGRENGPVKRRPASKLFSRWVDLAGGRIRQYTRQHQGKVASPGKENLSGPSLVRQESTDGHAGRWQAPPLRLVEVEDKEVISLLHSHMRKLPVLLHFFLCRKVFPLHTKHQKTKLSCAGTDLVGSNIILDVGKLNECTHTHTLLVCNLLFRVALCFLAGTRVD